MEDAATALRAQLRAGGLKMKQAAAALPENGAPESLRVSARFCAPPAARARARRRARPDRRQRPPSPPCNIIPQ